jgi:hypothetical protein
MVKAIRRQIARSPGLSNSPFSDEGWAVIEEALSTRSETAQPTARLIAPVHPRCHDEGCQSALSAIAPTQRTEATVAEEAIDLFLENVNKHGMESMMAKSEAIRDYREAGQYAEWAVFCAVCEKRWSVPYRHPGKSICEDCEKKAKAAVPSATALPEWAIDASTFLDAVSAMAMPKGWGHVVEEAERIRNMRGSLDRSGA